MVHLLRLDSSAAAAGSRTRALTATFAGAWTSCGESCTVSCRDLAADPLPHLPDASLHWPERLRPTGSAPPADAVALQEQLIAELIAADALVVGAPMYNYSLPSSLKAWIDFIHVPGMTAPFDTKSQPMAGKPAVVITARGASYDQGTPMEGWDYGTKVLEAILSNALGMEVTVIATNLTLAETVPLLADQLDRCRSELAAAHEMAGATARHLATREGR